MLLRVFWGCGGLAQPGNGLWRLPEVLCGTTCYGACAGCLGTLDDSRRWLLVALRNLVELQPLGKKYPAKLSLRAELARLPLGLAQAGVGQFQISANIFMGSPWAMFPPGWAVFSLLCPGFTELLVSGLLGGFSRAAGKQRREQGQHWNGAPAKCLHSQCGPCTLGHLELHSSGWLATRCAALCAVASLAPKLSGASVWLLCLSQ